MKPFWATFIYIWRFLSGHTAHPSQQHAVKRQQQEVSLIRAYLVQLLGPLGQGL